MSGPPPMDFTVRARANKASTRAVLGEDNEGVEIPSMPKHFEEQEVKHKGADGIVHFKTELVETPWHPMSIAWWNDIWPSPMAKQWHSSDIHGLYMLLELMDRFFHKPSTALHAEIRYARQPYGLTPLDRRRLEWQLASTKTAESRASKSAPPAPPKPSENGPDLRLVVD